MRTTRKLVHSILRLLDSCPRGVSELTEAGVVVRKYRRSVRTIPDSTCRLNAAVT